MTILLSLLPTARSGYRVPMPNELTELPASFRAGTTVEYTRTLADYPAGDGWTLTLHLAGVSVTSVEATADGNSFVVTIPATKTAALGAGLYRWIERVDLDGDVYDVDSGRVKIEPDLATAAAGDEQGWLERAVLALRAHLEGRLEAGMESYAIAGRQVAKIPIKEAADLLAIFESRLARLENPDRLGRSVLIRFSGTGSTQ
jgi:hypothetical protein